MNQKISVLARQNWVGRINGLDSIRAMAGSAVKFVPDSFTSG
jgi:hypothetical protein